MTTPSPIKHSLDGVDFHLAESTDLSFIQQYGRVFRVFDENDSGNISFGVDDGHRRRFIKLAGASTMNAMLSPEKASANLRRTEQIHRNLSHPHIVRFLESFEHGRFFGLIFDWTDGGLLLRRIENQPLLRFKALPFNERLEAFDSVIDVVQHTHDSGYVAVDIYDASFIYDFERKQITICDIDAFERKPMVNTMGRMYGSTRFMSPEEFELGAVIDEITNVYTLGAVAFLLFGNEQKRTMETWDAGDVRFEVAQRATSDRREERFASIAEFRIAWGR